MDGNGQDFELLLAAASHEIAVLRGDPRLNLRVGKRGAALRAHVLDLIGAVEFRMGKEPAPGATIAARRAFARSMRQSILMLRGAHAALPWLAATQNPTINLGSLYTTEEYARILVGPKVDLVVVPDPEFMYATTSWPFSAVIDTTRGFTPTTTGRPVVLNYPLSDADRLLLHPIFAHELGHASADEHGLVAAVEDQLDADPVFVAALQATVTEMAATYPDAMRTQVSGTLRGYLRDWIEELLCDHLAIEAAGPAFVWAFAAFVMPLSYGEPGSEHPPNTLRITLALAHLDRRGWRPYMDRVAPGVTAWLDSVAADVGSPLDSPFTFLRDQLLRHAKIVQDVAMGRAGFSRLLAEVAEPVAGEARALLQRLILPVGLSAPLELRAILLGGWQHAIEEHGDTPGGLVLALADEQLQGLLGKAIEMSAVMKAWEPVQ